VVRLTGPKKRSYWVDQNTSNLGLSGSIHPCLSSVWWRAATVSSSICTAAAAVIVSIREVRPIILHHRLRTSSSQSKRAEQDSSPSCRAPRTRSGRLRGRRLHVLLLRLQPQIQPASSSRSHQHRPSTCTPYHSLFLFDPIRHPHFVFLRLLPNALVLRLGTIWAVMFPIMACMNAVWVDSFMLCSTRWWFLRA